jgi:hypothetical protein
MSREFDARITPFLRLGDDPALPRIQCFYEVLADDARLNSLIAATTSMRAMGHSVNVWSYTPEKLGFLRPHGIELRAADEVLPKSLFDQIVAGSEIRYFSDIFRYAALYEHGGLWMETDVVLLRPFPFHGDYFFNLQWRPGMDKNTSFAATPFTQSRTAFTSGLFMRLRSIVFSDRPTGCSAPSEPELLSEYIASAAGTELRSWVFSPMFFNSIDWTEVDRFNQTFSALADYLNDDRVFGIHLWDLRNDPSAGNDNGSLIVLLSDPLTGFPNLISLADCFNTDKNSHTGNHHCYVRIYERLLSRRRYSLRRLMEIGLCRPTERGEQAEIPSVESLADVFSVLHRDWRRSHRFLRVQQ